MTDKNKDITGYEDWYNGLEADITREAEIEVVGDIVDEQFIRNNWDAFSNDTSVESPDVLIDLLYRDISHYMTYSERLADALDSDLLMRQYKVIAFMCEELMSLEEDYKRYVNSEGVDLFNRLWDSLYMSCQYFFMMLYTAIYKGQLTLDSVDEVIEALVGMFNVPVIYDTEFIFRLISVEGHLSEFLQILYEYFSGLKELQVLDFYQLRLDMYNNLGELDGIDE